MIYQVTNNFTRLNETSGIIQNTSNIYSVEISSSNEVDSGILIFPLNTLYFSGETFLRCTDENGRAYIRVVSFGTSSDDSDGSDGDSGGTSKTEPTLTVGEFSYDGYRYVADITYNGDGQLFANTNVSTAFAQIYNHSSQGLQLRVQASPKAFNGTLYAAEGDEYSAKLATFENT